MEQGDGPYVPEMEHRDRPLVLFDMNFAFLCKNYTINFNRSIIFSTTSNAAPGTPNNPTIIAVKRFKPMWNPKFIPTRFIIYIRIPPKTEFITNFKILLSGMINILPNINKKIIHAKNVITVFKSIFIISPLP